MRQKHETYDLGEGLEVLTGHGLGEGWVVLHDGGSRVRIRLQLLPKTAHSLWLRAFSVVERTTTTTTTTSATSGGEGGGHH